MLILHWLFDQEREKTQYSDKKQEFVAFIICHRTIYIINKLSVLLNMF